MGIIILMMLIGLGMVLGPFFFPVDIVSRWVLTGFGLFLIIASFVMMVFTQLYQRASAEEAMVRTGMRGAEVIIDGGIVVIPFLHKLTRVSLKVIKLTCVREGSDALITKDYLRSDVHSEFYM